MAETFLREEEQKAEKDYLLNLWCLEKMYWDEKKILPLYTIGENP